eukprot:TRINITY_DN26417_c0_g1_i1.p1 TRINITY_DN26417_c0_g1~~TRINITY_DN26417_c0_g1_i1.p1  ORF type:complete len:120 (+),score=9.52 TRINITY_DN26417_c0_g1_i1:62-421(+)
MCIRDRFYWEFLKLLSEVIVMLAEKCVRRETTTDYILRDLTAFGETLLTIVGQGMNELPKMVYHVLSCKGSSLKIGEIDSEEVRVFCQRLFTSFKTAVSKLHAERERLTLLRLIEDLSL